MSERIAMVGAGFFAQFQVESWRESGAPVLALCDQDAARAKGLAQRFGIAHCYTDTIAMLDQQRPTLLDVCVPPAAQEPIVRAALERGIPTICQKPFGTDLVQAEAMTALAEAAGVPLVIHENFRFTPWFREVHRLIGTGHFGRMYGASFRLRPGDGQGPHAYLDRQPYFQTMPQLLVRETGAHFIDAFRYLLGEVLAVTARLRRLNPAIVGEDSAFILMEFDDDRTGLLDGNRLSGHVAQNPRRTLGEMWVEGERGVMRLDGDARLWWQAHGGAETQHIYDQGGDGAFGGACTALQSHVLAHLRHGAPLQNSARDYLTNLHVEAAVYHSHANGLRVAMAGFNPHHPEKRTHI